MLGVPIVSFYLFVFADGPFISMWFLTASLFIYMNLNYSSVRILLSLGLPCLPFTPMRAYRTSQLVLSSFGSDQCSVVFVGMLMRTSSRAIALLVLRVRPRAQL